MNAKTLRGQIGAEGRKLEKLMFGEELYTEEQVQLIAEQADLLYGLVKQRINPPMLLDDLYEGPQQYNNVHAKWEQTSTYYIHTFHGDYCFTRQDDYYHLYVSKEPDKMFDASSYMERHYLAHAWYLLIEAYRIVTDGDVE